MPGWLQPNKDTADETSPAERDHRHRQVGEIPVASCGSFSWFLREGREHHGQQARDHQAMVPLNQSRRCVGGITWIAQVRIQWDAVHPDLGL